MELARSDTLVRDMFFNKVLSKATHRLSLSTHWVERTPRVKDRARKEKHSAVQSNDYSRGSALNLTPRRVDTCWLMITVLSRKTCTGHLSKPATSRVVYSRYVAWGIDITSPRAT